MKATEITTIHPTKTLNTLTITKQKMCIEILTVTHAAITITTITAQHATTTVIAIHSTTRQAATTQQTATTTTQTTRAEGTAQEWEYTDIFHTTTDEIFANFFNANQHSNSNTRLLLLQ